jgi:hypothetical protein
MRTVIFGRRCNQACPFCDADASPDAPPRPASDLRAEVDAAVAAGGVRFSGGEPFLERGILQAISYARARRVPVEISTHGRMLADPALVGRLRAAGATSVAVSLHGADAETHAAHIGGDLAAFAQVCAAVDALGDGVTRTVRTVVTRRNAEALPALAARVAAWGVGWELRALRIGSGRAASASHLTLPVAAAWVAADRARAAAIAAGVPADAVRLHGFQTPGDGGPVLHAPVPATDARLRRLQASGVDAETAAGLSTTDAVVALAEARRTTVREVGLSLAAARTPLVDQGVACGGLLADGASLPAFEGLAGARRVAVLVRPDTPLVWAVAAFPATVAALRAEGVDATLLSPWADGDRDDPRRAAPKRPFGARDPRPHPSTTRAGDPAVQAAWRQALAGLEHGSFDAALVDGAEGYAAAIAARIPRIAVLEASTTPWMQPLRDTDLLVSATPEAQIRYRALAIPLAQIAFLAPVFDLRLSPSIPRIAAIVEVDAEARTPARAGAIHLRAGVPIEAAAAWTTTDLPLLADDVPPLRHLLRDGLDGTLLAPGTPPRLDAARPARAARITTPAALAAWLRGEAPRTRVVTAFGHVGPWTSW